MSCMVVYLPLLKMMKFVSWDDEIPNILWKNKKYSKPPTRWAISVFVVLVFRWLVRYRLRHCLRRAYAIAWGSLRGVWFLRGAYASLRCRLCLRGHGIFVFEWGFGTTSHKYPTNKGKINEFWLLPASVYTKPARCRLKRAFSDAYATYAICMGAHAWGIVCLMEFPLHLLFIQKKKLLIWIGFEPHHGPSPQ